jgi:hypothetical protein
VPITGNLKQDKQKENKAVSTDLKEIQKQGNPRQFSTEGDEMLRSCGDLDGLRVDLRALWGKAPAEVRTIIEVADKVLSECFDAASEGYLRDVPKTIAAAKLIIEAVTILTGVASLPPAPQVPLWEGDEAYADVPF